MQKNHWNSALKIINVQRFKKRMLSLIAYRFKHQLTPSQLSLLNDKSYFTEVKSRIHLLQSTLSSCCSVLILKLPFSNFLQSVSSYASHLEAIQPNSSSLLIWKSFFILISFCSVYYYSLKASFGVGINDYVSNSIGLQVFFILFNIIFPLDMFIDLNTGFYQEGIVQHSRIKILQRSLFFDFWVHVLKIFLQFFYFQNDLSSFTSYLLCFLHLYTMSKDFAPLDQHQQIQQKWPVVRLVVLLLIVILTVAHLSGCFFYSLSLIESDYFISNFRSSEVTNCNNWVSCSALENQDWKIKYIFSLYFSFITMITVGYGDIFPVSVYEKIYVIIMTCITCGIFGYAINKIGSVINELAQKQLAQKQEQYEIINYMHNRQISKSTQIKVLKFIEHVQEKEKENPINGQLILKKVSKNLKQQVHEEYFGNILRQSKLFKLTFSSAFLEELITYMNEVLFSPDEVIFNSNDSTESILYFLVDGNIGVYSSFNPNETKLMEQIQKKEFVRLTSFFSEQIEENTVFKTIETSLIVSLLHKDFMKCINNHPTDLVNNDITCLDYLKKQFQLIQQEKYHNIKQSIIDSAKRLEQCSACGEFTHTLQQCHLLHLSLNTQLIKMKYQFSQSQLHRDPSKHRNRCIKVNTMIINKTIKKKIRMLRSNLILESRGHQLLDKSIDSEELDQETDKHFFSRVAQVKISQNQINTLSDLNDTGGDSNNSIESSELDSDSSDSQNSYDEMKEIQEEEYLIQEMDEEYGVDDIEESQSLKKGSYSTKKQPSIQQNIQSQKRISNVTMTNHNEFSNYVQKKARNSLQVESESSEYFKFKKDQPKSAINIEITPSIPSNSQLNEFQNSGNKKNIEKSRSPSKSINKKRKSNERPQQQNKQSPKKSISLPKQQAHKLSQNLKAQPLKSYSLPRNHYQMNVNKSQPLKSYSLPRYSQQSNLTEVTTAQENNENYSKNKYQNSQDMQTKKIDSGIEGEKELSMSSQIKSTTSLSGNYQQSNKSSQNLKINDNKNCKVQLPPQLKISFAPSLLNQKPRQDISVSKKHQNKIDIIINQLGDNISDNNSSFDDNVLSVSSKESLGKTNKEKKQIGSILILQPVQIGAKSENQSIRNQTDYRTTLPTQQDDYNYTEQFLINMNKIDNSLVSDQNFAKIKNQQQMFSPNSQSQRQKEEKFLQELKIQKIDKSIQQLNTIEDKPISIILKTPDSCINTEAQIQKSFNYQSDLQVNEFLSKSQEIKPSTLSINNQNFSKLKTFDEKIEKKTIKKSTLEFDTETDNLSKEKYSKKKSEIENKLPINRKNSNTSKEKRNNYLQSQLNRRRSFKVESDQDNPAPNTNQNSNKSQDLTIHQLKSINILNDEYSPQNSNINNNNFSSNNSNNNNNNNNQQQSQKENSNYNQLQIQKYNLTNKSISSIAITNPTKNSIGNANNNSYINTNNNSGNLNVGNVNVNNNNTNSLQIPQSFQSGQIGNLVNSDNQASQQIKKASTPLNQYSQVQKQSSFDEQQNQPNDFMKNPHAHFQNQNTYANFYSQTKFRDDLFIYDFDQGKEWTYYLPHNNQSYVIRELKKHQRVLILRQKNNKSKMQMIARQFMNKKRLTTMLQSTQQ